MQPHRANPNRMNDIKRKMVKSARQMVDKQLGTWTWVIFADVIDLVREEGATRDDDEEGATRYMLKRAQEIWNDACFTSDIYQTAEGKEATKAEIMCDWLKDKYDWHTCKRYFADTCKATGMKRKPDTTFVAHVERRIRENAL